MTYNYTLGVKYNFNLCKKIYFVRNMDVYRIVCIKIPTAYCRLSEPYSKYVNNPNPIIAPLSQGFRYNRFKRGAN